MDLAGQAGELDDLGREALPVPGLLLVEAGQFRILAPVGKALVYPAKQGRDGRPDLLRVGGVPSRTIFRCQVVPWVSPVKRVSVGCWQADSNKKDNTTMRLWRFMGARFLSTGQRKFAYSTRTLLWDDVAPDLVPRVPFRPHEPLAIMKVKQLIQTARWR